MFPQLNKFNVTLCSTDHLALYLQTQHVDDVLDLVDVAKHLVMADEVPVDHGGTSLKVLSEYSVARAALVQAEKADLGPPHPHREGTFLYVITSFPL